jgi:hypothetical protein
MIVDDDTTTVSRAINATPSFTPTDDYPMGKQHSPLHSEEKHTTTRKKRLFDQISDYNVSAV